MSSKLKILLAALLGLNLIFILFLVVGRSSNQAEQSKEKYPLLAKRIFMDDPNDTIVNFVPLRQAVKIYLSKANVEHSFFFEYLPTGTAIRSNENSQLAGASLLKLPTIISLYKAAEEGRINLGQVVSIKKEWLDDRFGDLWKRGEGAKITLAKAVRYALVDSDDTAIKTIRGVLGSMIPDNQTVLSQLDVDFPYTIDGQSKVSSRDYAAVMKCLYLSCYLNRENSQEILSQLADAPDFNRIAKPIPDNLKVAHKIGVFGSEVQSDCGIIYIPNRPYLVCILIKGPSVVVDQHMQALSKLVYDYVSDTNH
ncbi:hypothetical protein A3D14_02595 [Candidatus Saccharibacteria bacterium RIFCSPHIGHO2_02_FULL_47_12]|nr:MAG: hypothetical protein A3D14_02595 [Candidatus Saccharibacteria bacterium RIFCSPHIGHO2_02_FULL_47_12]